MSIALWNSVNFVIDFAIINNFTTKIEINDQVDQTLLVIKTNTDIFTKEILESQISIMLAKKLIKEAGGEFIVSSSQSLTLSLPKRRS